MDKILIFILITIIVFLLIVSLINFNNPIEDPLILPTSNRKLNRIREEIKRGKELTIHIEIDKKLLSLIDRANNNKTIASYPIASGKDKSPSPLGNFRILQKAKWGEGFGSRWIGLNVPWGRYGIHGTNNPGSIGASVSAGCIRMRNQDVEDLFDQISTDTNVLITNGEFGVFGQGFRKLRPGDRGADVLEVQKRLRQQGFYQDDLDGIYGEGLKKALIDFLREKKIDLTDEIDQDIYEELGIILMD